MKKLNKLQINPEKLIKYEELLRFRGGYEGPCTCTCIDILLGCTYGYLLCESGHCNACCSEVWPSSVGHCGNSCPTCTPCGY